MIRVYQDDVVRLDEGWRFARRIQTTIMEHTYPQGENVKFHASPPFLFVPGQPAL